MFWTLQRVGKVLHAPHGSCQSGAGGTTPYLSQTAGSSTGELTVAGFLQLLFVGPTVRRAV